MQVVIATAIAVVGGILAGVLSVLYRRGLRFWSSWHARAFWRSFLSGDVRIVVGRVNLPEDCDYNEPAGLVGAGDVHAATLIATYLGDLMVRQLGQRIEILDQGQLSGDLSLVNVICLGGPDVNDVSCQLLEEVGSSIRPASLVNDDPSDLRFIDTQAGDTLPSEAHMVDSKDFGLLVRGSRIPGIRREQ